MKTYIYQDEKSHKFWAVEQQDNELHISWGKIGTNGQSQVKSFADAAAAEKAELKLIAEKTKKGYVEEVSVITPTSVPVQVIECPEIAPLPQDKPVFVGDNLPWLADDAQIILPTEVAPTTLSHRRWPGDPVPQENELTLLRSVAANTHRRFKKVITFDYSTCSLDWQQAITQAVGLIDSPISTTLPPMVLAVLVALDQGFNRNDHEELMDQIVQEGGLEYATEVVIALQFIRFDWDYDAHLITFTPDNRQPGYLSRFASVEMRLRKHLSLANDDVWQRCADKLIAALGNMPTWHQPLVALLLPEKPEIAHEIARHLCGQKGLYALEWLKLTAADEQVLAELGKYYPGQPGQVFDDYYGGKIWCATILKEQGVAALARFAPYSAGDTCGEVLMHINHPQALTLLIHASEQGKRCHDRMTKAFVRFPHAAMAALAELLAQKDEKRWRMMLMTMLISQPTLAERIISWLSAPAVTVLKSCQQQLTQPSVYANADMLPAVLVSPPWLAKKKKSTILVLNLAPLNLESICNKTDTEAKEFQTHWDWEPHNPGEGAKDFLYSLGYRRWDFDTHKYIGASDSAIDAWEREDFATLIQMFKAHHAPYQGEWHLNSLPFLPMQKAIKLWEFLSKEPHTAIKPVMLYLRLAGMSGFLQSFSRYPQEGFAVANYFAATELAPAVARVFNKLKTLRQDARSWLLKYPEHAITGLLPSALGKAGEAQDNARAALRMLTENGHQPLLQEIARRYNQPEVTDAVNALLALDPLDNHPTKIPTLPAFYQPSIWTRPVLKANAQSLPDNALLHLGEMLRFPQEEALYPGLLQVKDACTADSLAEFAWDLFTAWQTAGAPSKESWAFTALGVLGNDDTARKLTPLIRAWPGESQHKRATVGLDILAAIGSDIALMQLNGIAQKLKFKALQERAKEKIADIAESRELTVAELEDRLAPDLGLDDNGSLLLDFGPRQFTVSFDETLKPFVRDASGSRLKDLPKPNKSDDESRSNDAVNRYKLLKKDARTVAAQQVARLESAMCLRRRWSPENFLLFLVEHPLVRHLTRRLIWGVYSTENELLACFRVAEDNSYSTADDDLFTLPEGDISVGIPHVLEISPTDAAAFGQLFADYELLPPFRQLDRNSYALTETERNASELIRWAGRKCPSGRVMGLANKGWIRGEPQDGGWIGWMIKPLGRWSLIMEIDEGFAVGMSPAELSAEQLLSKLWLWEGKAESYGWGSNSTQEAQFSVLDAITASELINDIEALFE
ncbi:WGR and DUF4132 domain-containing protein [Escherichia coli]|nr:WGR and DUF4132 domain-containing protein [Escherichia coli]MBY7177862.1 WGR and DUF4132 domain-containing protein [Escherichia coli]MBY7253375.1 WGR and DUF4132 domain-containing protein [Escherichia coli]MBY7268805.1 WGR and DUF4132 domain-containing protein [Escherichia coli]MBY7373455.1 WGR and DUF4132 domain-containing protein [Escherichia coli]MBY7395315.1 WGR and DUF4132 domain-containing protein [Escherichia coli]